MDFLSSVSKAAGIECCFEIGTFWGLKPKTAWQGLSEVNCQHNANVTRWIHLGFTFLLRRWTGPHLRGACSTLTHIQRGWSLDGAGSG